MRGIALTDEYVIYLIRILFLEEGLFLLGRIGCLALITPLFFRSLQNIMM
jgi:hypothetical protein